MSHSVTPVQCSCSCEANKYELASEPLVRFYCHCEVCQQFTGGPYSDVTVALAKDLNNADIAATEFKRMKLPPNIRRGKCTQCHKPSIELGIGNQLVFIPTSTVKNPEALPAPTFHMFYHRRVQDFDDNLPKYEGFIKSQLAATQRLVSPLLKRLF